MSSASRISVIIPVYGEQNTIAHCIENARQACPQSEIIVVDGSPYGSTIREINDSTILTISSAPGRAVQMNAGADAASGDILLFLHADTRLPAGASELITEALGAPASTAGAFKLSFETGSTALKIIAFIADLRSRLERVPYGDQAIFIRKDTFLKLGRFPEIPLMEDVEFFRSIKKSRREIVILQAEICTSARRYGDAPFSRALKNTILRILHILGVSPSRLVSMYR
ncbi:TIGR04283 family arsenosugar biosynthesis glycosyltransferase [Maridesulfovibrio sp. FT414]|uniref:TIGR04283 family arsenosugar biosynthesis glycosyltransferase n=1 Tax=Maridesulfovibrio sp. FT414 TaxID=2979469 RepID=UPI003D807FC6